MADEPLPWQPDDVVAGKYRLVSVLGEGGMGIVYEAQHVRLRQRLAIKMVRPTLATRNNVVLRFEREARAAAQLRSVHAAKVIDVDATPDGTPYIVMELLEGHNLANVFMSRRPLAVDEVIGWVLETCCAIAEAHDLGIVHRDLKPSNLFLAYESGRSVVKVLDFGISKLTDEGDVSLTTTQVTLGTPNYMSPEQVRSAKEVDLRTDIWSLGVILYELLTGDLPFPGATPSAILAAIVADPVAPMTKLRFDLPRELDAIVQKALSKRPEDRFADVRALASSLMPFARLDPYVGAEVAQMLRKGSLSPAISGVSSAQQPTATAPTAPGWSKITGVTARPRRWTFAIAAAAALAAFGWLARSTLQRGADPAASIPAPPTAAASAPPSASTADPVSEVADASVPAPAPEVPSKKPRIKAKPPVPPNKPIVPPPAPSGNPLHL
jgi:eukaryotic-like serine/threonine-protein kinase